LRLTKSLGAGIDGEDFDILALVVIDTRDAQPQPHIYAIPGDKAKQFATVVLTDTYQRRQPFEEFTIKDWKSGLEEYRFERAIELLQ
jgi:hypothetical protein